MSPTHKNPSPKWAGPMRAGFCQLYAHPHQLIVKINFVEQINFAKQLWNWWILLRNCLNIKAEKWSDESESVLTSQSRILSSGLQRNACCSTKRTLSESAEWWLWRSCSHQCLGHSHPTIKSKLTIDSSYVHKEKLIISLCGVILRLFRSSIHEFHSCFTKLICSIKLILNINRY